MEERMDPSQKQLPSRNHAGYILRVSPHFRDFNEGDPYNVSRTGYKLFKYYNRLHDIQNNDFNDAPVFRMGEVLVNFAEAKWELGEFDHLTAYVDARNGNFERVRHSRWRWFDFLWMFHTMDYAGRDNSNNWLLRAFSVFGLFTVLSGFTLYAVSSKTFLKTTSKLKKNK